MKRLLCALLCALLLLPAPAGAEDTATIPVAELMARQASITTLRAAAALTVSGPAPFFLTEAEWAALSAATPGTTLTGSYILSRSADTLGDSQFRLYLKRDGETLSTLRLNGRGDRFLLWGDALGNTVLSLPRDTEVLLRNRYLTLSGWRGVLARDAGLLHDLLAARGAWPGLLRALGEMFTADDAWRAQAEAALQKYYAHLSAWLQEQSEIRLVRGEGGELCTVVTLEADRSACAEEAIALLELYAGDTALHALLGEHTTEEEAGAYLEPGMVRLYSSVLRKLPEGEGLRLEREYAADGTMERFSLTLALTDTIALRVVQEGEAWEIALPWCALSVDGNAQTGWQGRFALAKEGETVTGGYQLFASMDKTYIDASSGKRQRRQDGMLTLIITPDEGQPYPAQLVTASLAARAGEDNGDAATWRMTLDWQETGGGADICLMFQAETHPLIRQTEAEGEIVALSDMGEDARAALWQAAREHLLRVLGIPAE